MNEFPTFQINAYMSYSLSRTITAKEYQVTFAQVAAGYPVAFFQLAVRAARQAYAVGFL